MHEENLTDDLSILDEDGLLRRVPNWPNMYVWSDNLNSYRPSSANFKDNELSVSLEKDLLDDGNSHSEVLKHHPGFGLLKVTAGSVRNKPSNKQKITRDPTPEDPYHAIVLGVKTKGDCRKLLDASELIIEPELPPPASKST